MPKASSGHIASGGPAASGGLVITDALGGFFWPVFVQMPTQALGATSITGANVIRCMQFVLPFGITIRQVTMRNGATISAGGKFGSALYDINKNLLIDSGFFSESVSGIIQTNVLPSPVVVPAGAYYYAYAADNTTGNLAGMSYDTTVVGPMMRKTTPRIGTAANAYSNVTGFPATLGVITSVEIISIALALYEA